MPQKKKSTRAAPSAASDGPRRSKKSTKKKPAAKKSTSKEPLSLEQAGKRSSGNPHVWTLRLYVAGEGQRSRAALDNLRRLCQEYLDEDEYEIEVIDLVRQPHLAKADQILAIPTLVRKIPEPVKRVIGDLSNADRAMIALDLPSLKME